MIIACWSPKGGSGTTVVSAALALTLAREHSDTGVVVADLAGDIPAVLGLAEAGHLGLSDWLAADSDVPGDALARLEVHAGHNLRLLPVGTTPRPAPGTPAERAAALVAVLHADPRPVVVDCGSGSVEAGLAVASEATLSVLVLRPCYLALRRALTAPIRPSGVVVVAEPDRSLGRQDVEEVLQAPVLALVPVEPAVARAVDAGLLARRLPRVLEAATREVVAQLPARPSNASSPDGQAGVGRRRSHLRSIQHR